jgi:hypothetical protein
VKTLVRAAQWTAAVLLALALAAQLVGSPILKREINRKLAAQAGFAGHVDGVSLQLWRRTIRLSGITLAARGSKSKIPVVSVDKIDVRCSWKPLFRGAFVGDIALYQPVVHLNKKEPIGKNLEMMKKAAKVKKPSVSFVRTFEVHGGRVEWQDDDVRPGYTLALSKIRATAHELGSYPGLGEQVTTASITAKTPGNGRFLFNAASDALAKKPTFDYKLVVSSVSLPALNDWITKYLNVKVSSGTMDVYNEARAKGGKVGGFVKPIVTGLESVEVKGKGNIGKTLKGEAEKLAAGLLKRHPTNEIATEVDFKGDLNNPKIKTWQAVGKLVQNAFFKAIKPGLKGDVELGGLSL